MSFKQQQMPCDDNKAPSWKSERKTKEKNWKSGIPTFENSWTTGTGRDVLLSPTLRVFIRRMIWTFILERNSFWVRFITQLQIWKTSKIHLKHEQCFYLMGVYHTHGLNIDLGKNLFLCQVCNSASNFKGFSQDI